MADSNVQERLYRLVVDGGPALRQLDSIANAVKKTDQSIGKMGETLKGAFAALGVAVIAKDILQTSEKLNNLSASLAVLRGSAAEGTDAFNRVFNIVTKTGAAFEDVGQSVQRLSIAMKDLGASNAQIERVTTSFIELGRIGGSSMQDINESLVQFGQALSSGKLQGDELKSISERLPLVMQRIADSLKVPVGALKQMGAEGKLTADVVANALLANTEELDKAFAQLPETFEQGMNRIRAQMALTEQQWFNQSEAALVMSRSLKIIANEIASARQESSQWTPIIEDIQDSFKQIGHFVVSTIGEVKQLGLALQSMGQVGKAVFSGDFASLEGIKAANDAAYLAIEATTAASHKFLDTGKSDLTNYNQTAEETVELLKSSGVAAGDLAKQTKAAEAEAKKLGNAWKAYYDAVKTPDEKFDEQAAEVDKLVAALHPAADQVERVRANLEKLRNEANEKIRIENLTEFRKGFEDAQNAIKETADEAEQVSGKLALLAKLGPPESWSNAAFKLAEGLGQSATAADQVAVAVRKVKDEGANIVALTAEFEKLKESGRLTTDELNKVKQALGGLGENVDQIQAISVAIGQTLSNSVSGFVDVLLDSEKSFKDWAASLIAEIGKVIVQLVLLQQIKAAAGAMGFGALFGAAQGATFPGGMSLPQGVYHDPTLFKFAKGGVFGNTGILAEAGSEAVVPLKRTAGGDLGVQASPVNIFINNTVSDTAEVKVEETNKTDGTKEISILIERKIKTAMSDGSLDSSFRENYNLSRAAR